MTTINKDEEVKIAIMEAAKRVFQKWGLNKTTMEDIAHEAGKGKSTLYYYYKSKDELFKEFAISELNLIINKAKASIDQISSARAKLKKYIATLLIEMKKSVSIFPLLNGEIKGNKKIMEQLINEMNEKEESVIEEILTLGFNTGEFHFLNKNNIQKAANVTVAIARGLQLYLFFDNEDNEKIDIVTRMISEGM
ncbi:MAG: helix-turn-helix domain-containing protein [Ignavibacteria bacterium]|jgi:AcrR family transcriptional regulator